MLPIKYKDGWTSGPRPEKRDDVALIQAMFGLDYGAQQGLYGPSTSEDLAAILGLSEPVMVIGWEVMRLAAEKGVFANVNPIDISGLVTHATFDKHWHDEGKTGTPRLPS